MDDDEISRELPLEDVVDIDGLMDSSEFAEEMALWYLPENFPADLANREIFGLYRLLKDEEELTLDCAMQYILYQMINGEIEQIEDSKSDELCCVLQIPELDRSVVMATLEKESIEHIPVEELIAYYEDLQMYDMICFEDTDFLLFDDFYE